MSLPSIRHCCMCFVHVMPRRVDEISISYWISYNKNMTTFFLGFSWFLKWNSFKHGYKCSDCLFLSLQMEYFCIKEQYMWENIFSSLFLIINLWQWGKFCDRPCSFGLARRCHCSSLGLTAHPVGGPVATHPHLLRASTLPSWRKHNRTIKLCPASYFCKKTKCYKVVN